MKEKNISFCREELEKLSSLELDQILRTELDNGTPERETVLLVLSILENRDPTNPANRIDGSLEKWNKHVIHTGESEQVSKKSSWKANNWFVPAAAVAVVVLVLLMTVPQTVGAENIFELIGRWTRDLFSFSEAGNDHNNEGYVFKTDHEGLQQVFDAVTEQGVTDPIVPIWIPEGYALKEFRVLSPNENTKIYSRFTNGDMFIQFAVEIYGEERSNKYTKDEIDAEVYDFMGVYYYIVPNEDTWKAVWNNGRAECLLVTNEAKGILYQILDSIQRRITE